MVSLGGSIMDGMHVVPTVAPEGSGNMYDASYEWPEDSIPMNSKPVQIVYNVHALATKDTKHKIASAAVSLTTILLLWLVLRDAPAAATPAAKPAQHSAITPEPAPEPAPEPSVPMPEPFPQCLDSGEHPTCGDHGGCGQALGGLWECRCDSGWEGPTCSDQSHVPEPTPVPEPEPALVECVDRDSNRLGLSTCDNGRCSKAGDACECYAGFSGEHCEHGSSPPPPPSPPSHVGSTVATIPPSTGTLRIPGPPHYAPQYFSFAATRATNYSIEVVDIGQFDSILDIVGCDGSTVLRGCGGDTVRCENDDATLASGENGSQLYWYCTTSCPPAGAALSGPSYPHGSKSVGSYGVKVEEGYELGGEYILHIGVTGTVHGR